MESGENFNQVEDSGTNWNGMSSGDETINTGVWDAMSDSGMDDSGESPDSLGGGGAFR